MNDNLEPKLSASTVRVARRIIEKLKEDMLSSPVDDITIISRPNLELLEAAVEIAGRSIDERS